MPYIKEDIESMLKQHKENEAKLTEIELKIEEYQQRLDYAGTVYEDTEQEIIENMQLAGQSYDSVHSNTNKISDKVSSTALNYHKEQYHINREDRSYLENQIESLKQEKDRLNKIIVRVKNLIEALDDKQKFIIEKYYIENKGKNWDKVQKKFKQEYQEIQKRQLQYIRDDALNIMLNIVNCT